MWVLLAVGMLALIWRLMALQFDVVTQGKTFLQTQGDARVIRDVPISAVRGEIVDRHGELLAYSTPVKSIFARPSEVDKSRSSLMALASMLDMNLSSLQKRLQANDHFVFLRRQLEPSKADAVLQQGFSGVYAQTEYQRFYPAGEVASHLIGFTDVDDRGQEGVELAFDHRHQ